MRPRSIGLVLIIAAGLGCGSENIDSPAAAGLDSV
jgi:hypothetical protein